MMSEGLWMIFETISNFSDQILFLYLIERQFPEDRPTYKKNAVALLVLGSVLSTLKHLGVPVTVSFMIMFSLHLSYCFFFRKGSNWQRLLWPIVARLTYMALDFITSTFLIRLPGFTMQLMIEQSPQRFIAVCCYTFLSFVAFWGLAQIRTRKHSLPRGTSIATFIIAVFCVFMTGFICERVEMILDQEHVWIIAVITAGFLFMSMAWLFIMDSFASQYENSFAMQSELQQAQTERRQVETLQILYEHLRGLRHDFSNQMLGLYGYAQAKDYQGLIDHLDNLQEGIERDRFFTLASEPHLDALIGSKLSQAERMNIKVSCYFVAPLVLPLSSTDACAIFGNILNNALEAAAKVTEEERYLDLVAEPVENMWRIRLENASNGIYQREKGLFRSLKEGDFHGLGLKRVEALAEANAGYVLIDAGSDSFAIEVFLPWSVQTGES